MLGFGSKPDNASAGDSQAAQNTVNSGPAEIMFDVGTNDFEQRVVHASMTHPVLVQFHAPWCGPCKQLSPVIEKVVQAAGGKVLLARVDLDQNQQLAAALRVQSVPTVFAFFQGQPVDAFQGVQPESQIQALVDKLTEIARQAQPEALDIPEALKTAGECVAAGDFQSAMAIYADVLREDTKNVAAYCGMVRTYISAGQIDQAQALYDAAPEEIVSQGEFEALKSALDLAKDAPDAGVLEALSAKIESNEKDHEARLELARGLFALGRADEAIDQALESLRRDTAWNEGAARKQILEFFDALGASDPMTIEGRKKFSALLFS